MEQLVEENTLLRQKVADLTTKLNENTWARFTQPGAPIDNNKCVVVGNTMLRH